jgi:hypothetical protein
MPVTPVPFTGETTKKEVLSLQIWWMAATPTPKRRQGVVLWRIFLRPSTLEQRNAVQNAPRRVAFDKKVNRSA